MTRTRTWPWLLLLVALFLAASGEWRCAHAQEMCSTQEPISRGTQVESISAWSYVPFLGTAKPTLSGTWDVPIIRPAEEVILWPAWDRVVLYYGKTSIVIDGPDAVSLGERILKTLARAKRR